MREKKKFPALPLGLKSEVQEHLRARTCVHGGQIPPHSTYPGYCTWYCR